ncbi:hypothetical protein [Arcobacter sp.]|uniref:hypothetical protein n=1 Tax=Arcobacter sp. TaxID=1872629 RepID=UPI003D14C4C0
MRIGRGRKNKKSFYIRKLKAYIDYLRNLDNEEINTIVNQIDNKENIFSESFIDRFITEWHYFNKEITRILNQCILRRTIAINLTLWSNVNKITQIIFNNDSISNIEFIKYLYKNEIALVMGDSLQDFHEFYYKDALKRKSIKDLMQIYKFKYINNSFKLKVARSILSILKNIKNTKKELLEEWSFNALPNNEKVDYLKSLKWHVSEEDNIRLLKMYAQLDCISKVKYYIFNELYSKGILEQDLELRKIAFSENITNKGRGSKYFHLLFNQAKKENDVDTIKWMYSQYSFKDVIVFDDNCIGRKDVADFLNLPLYKK